MANPTPPHFLRDERELRGHLPPPNPRIAVKIRPQLDAASRAWVENAALVGIAVRRPDGLVEVLVRARPSGVARASGDSLIAIDEGAEAAVGEIEGSLAANPFAGAIFIAPGENSTIRANGRAAASTAGSVELEVAEVYMHCPKAFVRSALWSGADRAAALGELGASSGDSLGEIEKRFIEASPFLLLGTCLEDGGGDVSPRGDPAGFVRVIDSRTLLIPERRGNQIADSLRNILANPVAGLLFLVPGSNWVLRVAGRARVTAERELLEPLAVQGRAPQLGIWVEVCEAVLEQAPALTAAGIWNGGVDPTRTVPSFGRTIIEQIEPSGRFHAAKAKVVDWLIARDAKKNLY